MTATSSTAAPPPPPASDRSEDRDHKPLAIPLNLDNWRHLSDEAQTELLWFHQLVLDEKFTLDQCGEALDFDTTNIPRVLKGTYGASYDNVVKAIRSFRRIHAERGNIQRNQFVPNSISTLIWAGLDYAMASNCITLITGESRMGKTVAAKVWRDNNNHGRSCYVVAPAYGGPSCLLREIGDLIRAPKYSHGTELHSYILNAFNRNRILIVDEAHRLLPDSPKTLPRKLEILRDLHDQTGCALALISTQRFDTQLKKLDYMYEQILGRIEMPVKLKQPIKEADMTDIVKQYVRTPSTNLMTACLRISNERGRLGILVGILKAASRIAAKESGARAGGVTDKHFFKALAIRQQMSGE